MTAVVDAALDRAAQALRTARRFGPEDRRRALTAVADALDRARDEILAANALDVSRSDLGPALTDRLRLGPDRAAQLSAAVRSVAEQPDVLGRETPVGTGPSGIEVFRRRVPLGVIAVVYEARPNVTAECAALAVASGNAVVLRGGKEASASNRAIGAAVRAGLAEAGFPEDLVGVLAESTREDVISLLGAAGRVDLVIPRGGEGLMRLVDEHARVPVIRHGQGVCHVYVDAAADLGMAANIAENAKVQRPGVCNAMETLLVHERVLEPLFAALGPRLAARGVEIRADEPARAALSRHRIEASAATSADWDTEFQDLILAVRTVPSLTAALDHIDRHGTHHSAAIVTENDEAAERFIAAVDASCVLWNASTRFNDGGELGLGAELGISTSRMHAYGPMSVRELTAEKFVVRGKGQIRR